MYYQIIYVLNHKDQYKLAADDATKMCLIMEYAPPPLYKSKTEDHHRTCAKFHICINRIVYDCCYYRLPNSNVMCGGNIWIYFRNPDYYIRWRNLLGYCGFWRNIRFVGHVGEKGIWFILKWMHALLINGTCSPNHLSAYYQSLSYSSCSQCERLIGLAKPMSTAMRIVTQSPTRNHLHIGIFGYARWPRWLHISLWFT